MVNSHQIDMIENSESWFDPSDKPYSVLGFCWVARLMNSENKRIAEIGSTMDVFAGPEQALQDYQKNLAALPQSALDGMDFILQMWLCSTYFEPHIQELQKKGTIFGGFSQKKFIREINLGKSLNPAQPEIAGP